MSTLLLLLLSLLLPKLSIARLIAHFKIDYLVDDGGGGGTDYLIE